MSARVQQLAASKSASKTATKIRKTVKIDHVQEIDGLFKMAGLVRNLKGNAGAKPLSHRFDQAAAEELTPRPSAPRVAANGAEWLAVPGWQRTAWLWHGFSTRRGGVSQVYRADEDAHEAAADAGGELNLGFTADDSREAVAQNRKLLVEAVTGSADTTLVALRQIHSNLVRRASKADVGRERPWKADGLITDELGLLLGIQTADCIPILVADKKLRAVGAFHAGWRGTVKRIVETGIARMRLEFGSRPEDLVAAIGPGASACCYSVGEEVLSEFESQFQYAQQLFREVYSRDAVRDKYPMLFLTQRAPGHSPIGPSLHLDLVEANRRQLLDAGLKPGAITVVSGCTHCQTEMFFSHRASKGHAGRMMAVIGVKP